MLGAGSPQSGEAGHLAIECVTGALHGRRGSFVLQRKGGMHDGEASLWVGIVPATGTDELEAWVARRKSSLSTAGTAANSNTRRLIGSGKFPRATCNSVRGFEGFHQRDAAWSGESAVLRVDLFKQRLCLVAFPVVEQRLHLLQPGVQLVVDFGATRREFVRIGLCGRVQVP